MWVVVAIVFVVFRTSMLAYNKVVVIEGQREEILYIGGAPF